MRKAIVFCILAITLITNCMAQWWMLPRSSFPYNIPICKSKSILVIGDTVYTIRSGGLEELNISNHNIKYHFQGFYPLKCIVADTGNTIVYLKGTSFIGRYNDSISNYYNIWPEADSNKYIADIDVSSDGKVWAATAGVSREVAVFNGSNWTFYPLTTPIFSGFTGIRIFNDTMAYAVTNNNCFYAFHNGVFDSLYTYTSVVEDWDVDNAGGIWIAAANELIHVFGGSFETFSSSNTPIPGNQFLHVKTGTNGHVWVAGTDNTLFKYDGAIWTSLGLPPLGSLENFTLSKQNEPTAIYSENNLPFLYYRHNGTWDVLDFPFTPFNNLKALGISGYYNFNIATNDGLFTCSDHLQYIVNFSDTSSINFANDITCFVDYDQGMSFGTHHGMQNLPGFDNSMLPNDTINHACYDNGTYYIATNNGLISYNGASYNTFNTGNSPLPSNKITFVSSGNNSVVIPVDALYIGTDKGLAIYQNTQWNVYDTSNVPVSSFYVSGVMPAFNDSATYISTIGNGLIKVYPDGAYQLFNTSTGNFPDDTLYFLVEQNVGNCGHHFLMGTSSNGVVVSDFWQQEDFYFETNYNGIIPIKSSQYAATHQYLFSTFIFTDSLFFYSDDCGSVAENNIKNQCSWFQNGDDLVITVPENMQVKGAFLLTDILGKALIEKDCDAGSGKIIIDVGRLESGIYFFQFITGDNKGGTKVLISH